MKYVVVGLGNPGDEYVHTRHNIGRMVVEAFARTVEASDWYSDKKYRARTAKSTLETGEECVLVLPDNYMNRSGGSVVAYVKNMKQAERTIVVHDDIDLPFGMIKIVFDRGAGGHNGVNSIEHALKTRRYVRVRVGVLPVTPTGKLRKPKGADKVHSFILKKLSAREREALAPIVERAAAAVLSIVRDGRDAAMRDYNERV